MNASRAAGLSRLIGRLFQPLTFMVLFVLVLLFTGGSSWGHEYQLIVLRPLAVALAVWGLASARLADFRRNPVLWLLFAAVVALTISHLLPLPYGLWTALGGRQIIADIDAAAGLGRIARPLSMAPAATWNALLSLAVPLAVLVLAMRLDEGSHRRIAGILIVCAAISGLTAILQISGVPISLYDTGVANRAPGLFNNRNHQALFLAMVFPLSALAWAGGFGWGLSARVERGVALAACLFALLLSLATGSRAGLMLMGAALVLMLILIARSGRGAGGRPAGARKALLAKGAAGLAAIALLVTLAVWGDRAETLSRLVMNSPELRFPLWQSIVAILPTYLPWGSGIGSYGDVYQILEPDAMMRATFSNHAHNEFLEIAFTAGWPGLLILLVAVVAFVLGSVRVWRRRGQEGAISQLGFILILLLALASMVDYPARTPIMAGIMALAAIWFAGKFEADLDIWSTRD